MLLSPGPGWIWFWNHISRWFSESGNNPRSGRRSRSITSLPETPASMGGFEVTAAILQSCSCDIKTPASRRFVHQENRKGRILTGKKLAAFAAQSHVQRNYGGHAAAQQIYQRHVVMG